MLATTRSLVGAGDLGLEHTGPRGGEQCKDVDGTAQPSCFSFEAVGDTEAGKLDRNVDPTAPIVPAVLQCFARHTADASSFIAIPSAVAASTGRFICIIRLHARLVATLASKPDLLATLYCVGCCGGFEESIAGRPSAKPRQGRRFRFRILSGSAVPKLRCHPAGVALPQLGRQRARAERCGRAATWSSMSHGVFAGERGTILPGASPFVPCKRGSTPLDLASNPPSAIGREALDGDAFHANERHIRTVEGVERLASRE